MSEQLAERLELENAHMEDTVEFGLDPPAEGDDWTEGVEHLSLLKPEELYQRLGLDKQSIPFFRDYITEDASGELGDLETGAASTKRFTMRWHQLVGTLRLLERALTSEPVLLMDDVGLGKTTQVLAMFAMLVYYRECENSRGYPGRWGE
jgi:hypothetical protein